VIGVQYPEGPSPRIVVRRGQPAPEAMGDRMAFVPGDVTDFRFDVWRFDPATGVVEFDYRLIAPDSTERFTERISFEMPATELAAGIRSQFEAVLVVLGCVLGLSYYKAAAPPRFEVAVDGVTDAATTYLRCVLREGLAEFAYRAGFSSRLDPKVVVLRRAAPRASVTFMVGDPLVPIGGGKDSVVTVESLVAVGFAPIQVAVNPNAITENVAQVSGRRLVAISRRLDPRLLELNDEGALNGHVPVTAMNSLLAIAQALLLGLGPVIMSNESSASDPTLDWNGVPVNHQWSKSLEAERALIAMLAPQAGLEGAYYSLLRPFSELRIARAFARTSGYDNVIVSCNRAFRTRGATPSWCAECDKCRFVFLVFAPYIDPDRLIGIVGADLFASPSQLPGFRSLVGLGEHKPFECVGEEAESSVALSLVSQIPRWAQSAVIAGLVAEAPDFAVGDPDLERQVLAESEAVAMPPLYEKARRALL
jgi:hypothetical protein